MPKYSLADDILVLNANIGNTCGKLKSWDRIRLFLEWYEKINPNCEMNYQMVQERGDKAPLILPGGMHLQPNEQLIPPAIPDGDVDIREKDVFGFTTQAPVISLRDARLGPELLAEIHRQADSDMDNAPEHINPKNEKQVVRYKHDPFKRRPMTMQAQSLNWKGGREEKTDERAKYLTDVGRVLWTNVHNERCPAIKLDGPVPLSCLLDANHEGDCKFKSDTIPPQLIVKRVESLEAVDAEIQRQGELKKAGRFKYTISDSEMSDFERLAVLGEEFGEVSHEVNETIGGHQPLDILRIKKELIQVAAIAVAWFERF